MPRQPIVSSSHLVSQRGAALSEAEFALIMAGNAFSRWIVRCMTAAGQPDLSSLDVLILHFCTHRQREKRLSDICLMLNIEDSHVVSYGLKKLVKQELLGTRRQGKEVFYRATDAGVAACEAYREVRERCLMDAFAEIGTSEDKVGELASLLRAISGLYDQAARAAVSL